MNSFGPLNTTSREEVDYYISKVEEVIGWQDKTKGMGIVDELKNLNHVLISKEGKRKSILLATKWKNEFKNKFSPENNLFDWIDTPRISGYCVIIIDFNSELFSQKTYEIFMQDHQGPRTERIPRVARSVSSRRLQEDRYKAYSNGFSGKIKKDNPQPETLSISYIPEPSKEAQENIATLTDANTHELRVNKIIKYITDASEYTNEQRPIDAFQLMLDLKYSWQNVYLLNQSHFWIEEGNEEQLFWVLNAIKKEYEEFILPWLATSPTSLYEALVTFIDVQWNYDAQKTKRICNKLRKAWLRKVNEQSSENNVSISVRSKEQLVSLEAKLKKTRKSIVRTLIEQASSETLR